MPKMKTHKGTAKRVKVTGSGKLMVRWMNPKRNKRSKEEKLQLIRRNRVADNALAKQIGSNLPYSRAAR